MLRVYYDTCCMGRLHDESRELRVSDERQIMLRLVGDAVFRRRYLWIGSTWLIREMRDNPDPLTRRKNLERVKDWDELVVVDRRILSSGTALAGWGLPEKDAVHVACALQSQCDRLVTVDDRLRRACGRLGARLGLSVIGLQEFLLELAQ